MYMSSSVYSFSSLLRFVKLSEHARSPTRGSPKAAGLDLYGASSTTVPARGKQLIFTDMHIQLPNGCYGRIAPTSGLALNHHIDIGGVVIDQVYRDNVCHTIIRIPRLLLHVGTVSHSLYVRKFLILQLKRYKL